MKDGRTIQKLLQGKPEGGTIKNLGEREWMVSNWTSMWVSREGEKKALDRREWASIMREAKARCKGQYCQRIRRRRSGRRRREFKRHIICVKSAGYFNRVVWLKPREIRTKHGFPILSVGNAYKLELNFSHPDIPQAFVSIGSGTRDFKFCRLTKCCILFQNSATGLSSVEHGSPLMQRYSEIIEVVKTCENQPRP